MKQEFEDSTETCLTKALSLIARRMHGKQELERKLLKRGFSHASVMSAFRRLSEMSYLNDQEFAEAFALELISKQKYGYIGLVSKLIQRGVERIFAEELLQEHFPIELEEQIAKKIVSGKKIEKQKIPLMLQRRGFRSEVISKFVGYD